MLWTYFSLRVHNVCQCVVLIINDEVERYRRVKKKKKGPLFGAYIYIERWPQFDTQPSPLSISLFTSIYSKILAHCWILKLAVFPGRFSKSQQEKEKKKRFVHVPSWEHCPVLVSSVSSASGGGSGEVYQSNQIIGEREREIWGI